jgi:cobalt-zinc-cadmium efflux system protein
MIVGGVGPIADVLDTLLLHRDAADNINIRTSYLHLFADSMSSAAVIIGGLFIYLLNTYWIDQLLALAVSVYVLHEGSQIRKESANIIMMVAPPSVDINRIKAIIEQLPAAMNVHHVHASTQSEHDLHFEVHVDVRPYLALLNTTELQTHIIASLAKDIGINHVTLQFERGLCAEKELVWRDG